MITNVHERALDAPPTEIGTLIDRLASDGDRLWPSDRWPPMRLDRPLGVGGAEDTGRSAVTTASRIRAMPTDPAAIRTARLSKRYGETLALDGLDLAVEPGEVYGYLGPNGAGKTTTIRLLLGCFSQARGGRRCSASTPGASRSPPTAGSRTWLRSHTCGRR